MEKEWVGLFDDDDAACGTAADADEVGAGDGDVEAEGVVVAAAGGEGAADSVVEDDGLSLGTFDDNLAVGAVDLGT